MGTFVHEELKSHTRVPPGRLLYVYTAATGGSLATLLDKDGAAIANPIELGNSSACYGKYGGVAIFKSTGYEQLWGITDYDLVNGITERRPLVCIAQNDVDLGALTADVSELNLLTGVTNLPQVFDVVATTAEVNAGTKVIVPVVSGKSFWPIIAAMQAVGGNASGATLVRLVEQTSSGVVLSHVVADMTAGTWVGITGGTVVATLMDKPLVADKAILIDKTGVDLATCTAVRAVVVGSYV